MQAYPPPPGGHYPPPPGGHYPPPGGHYPPPGQYPQYPPPYGQVEEKPPAAEKPPEPKQEAKGGSSNGHIKVDHFNEGMAVEAVYITPNNGRPTLNLKDDKGNTILHVNPRWDQRVFVLNTHHGKWGQEERPGGFDFSSGVPLTLRVEAHSAHFTILINGHILHCYKHRLPVSTLRRIEFHWSGKDKEAKLIRLSVCY